MRKKKGVAWLLSAAMILSSVQMGMISVAAEPAVEDVESGQSDDILEAEEISVEEEMQNEMSIEDNVESQKNEEEKAGEGEEESGTGETDVLSMTLGQQYEVEIEKVEDVKWFSFTPDEDGEYEFYFPGDEEFIKAEIYDSEKTNCIADGWWGWSIICTLEKDITYYLKAGVVEEVSDSNFEYRVAVQKVPEIASIELAVDNYDIPDLNNAYYELYNNFELKITYTNNAVWKPNNFEAWDKYGRRIQWSVDGTPYVWLGESPMNMPGEHTLCAKYNELEVSVAYRICDCVEWLADNAEKMKVWNLQDSLNLTDKNSIYQLKDIEEKTYKLTSFSDAAIWVFDENGEKVTYISFDQDHPAVNIKLKEGYYLYVQQQSAGNLTIYVQEANPIRSVELSMIPEQVMYSLENPFENDEFQGAVRVVYDDLSEDIPIKYCKEWDNYRDEEGNLIFWKVVDQDGKKIEEWYRKTGSYQLIVTVGTEQKIQDFSVCWDLKQLNELKEGNNQIESSEDEKCYKFTPDIGGDYLLGDVTKLQWIQDTNGVNKDFDGDKSDEFGSCGMVSLRKDQTYIFCFRPDYNEDSETSEYTFIISSVAGGETEELSAGDNEIQLTWNVPKVYKVSPAREQDSISYYDVSAHGEDVSMMVWYEGKTASNGLSEKILLTNRDYLVITGSGNVTLTVTEKQTKITDISFVGNLPEISVGDYLHQIPGTVDVTFTDASGEMNTEQIGFDEVSRCQDYVIRMYLKDADGNIFDHSDTPGTFELCVSTAGLEKAIGNIVVKDLNTEEEIYVNESKLIRQKLFQYYCFVPEYTATYKLEGNREFEGILVFYDADASQEVDTEWGQAELKAGKTYYVGGKKYDDEDLTITLTMVQKPITDAEVTSIPAQDFTGTALRPKLIVSYQGETLTEGKDYKLAYRNNKNPGTAKIIITGKDDYVGTKEVMFDIIPPVLPEVPAKPLEESAFMETIPDQTCTGNAIEPEIVVRLKDSNEKLKKDIDYTVSYSSNVEPGTAHVIVTGKGDYTGTLEGIFKIVDNVHVHEYSSEPKFNWVDDYANCDAVVKCKTCDMEETYVCTVTKESDSPSCSKEGKIVYTAIVVISDKEYSDMKEVSLKKLEHTVVKSEGYHPTCTESGLTEGSHCAVCGAVIIAQKEIPATGHTYKTTTTKATTKKNGSVIKKCTVCGDVASSKTIYYPKAITLSKTSFVYSGKVQRPTVSVKGSNGKTITSSNYTVTYSSGCKNVGKYTVKLTLKGYYSGSISKTYTIIPKGTVISGLTAQPGGFTVKWKKQSTQTTGYQIQYSTSGKFTSARTVTVPKNSTVSKTISKLSRKRKYYVRVRTYKTINRTNYYSAWSSAKVVTTKK